MTTKNTFKDYFEILEIMPSASPVEVKRAYKTKAKKTHPDQNKDPKIKSGQKFIEVQEAYETLIDPLRRREYLEYYLQYKRVAEREEFRKRVESQRRQYSLIFYYCKAPGEIEKSREKKTFQDLISHYKEISKAWGAEIAMEARQISDNSPRQKIRTLIQDMYDTRDQKKNISGFEFHGELVIRHLTDLAEELPECLVTLQLLLHDMPHHSDNYLVGYALYFLEPKLEIWLEDNWTEYAKLLYYLKKYYRTAFRDWPEDILYPFSRLSLSLKVLSEAEKGSNPIDIVERIENKVPLNQVQMMVRWALK
ncbi:MAG: hypothetical protein CL521_03705 [Actinobacteria bacterium]|nr:hypothetical protein [Actinomycetota bacterium]